MTFLELAEAVLQEAKRPLSAQEIWEESTARGLDKSLNSSGRTPNATLAAQLYVSTKKSGSIFEAVGKSPKQFYLKSMKHQLDFEGVEVITDQPKLVDKVEPVRQPEYLEKDLHPFLAHFAAKQLHCHCKTISASKSKRAYGEWVHPDMVGCKFSIGTWESEVLELSSAVGHSSVQFFSFELKKRLSRSNLRESFFQAVSNSSWAHQGYLVAAEISENPDFLTELNRLTSAFGIGVIQLNLKDPSASQIKYRAADKDVLDWETINKLVEMNTDFSSFVKRVRIDINSKDVVTQLYDEVLSEEKLIRSVRRK